MCGDSGVFYWNRVGVDNPSNPLNSTRREEGFFVPISNDPPLDQSELSLVPRLNEIASRSQELTPGMVNQLDDLLHEVSSSDAISVDASKLKASAPGWVYLNIMAQGEFSYFSGFGGEGGNLQGVLTWPCRES
nr:DUF6210 family protein [Aestuariicella hydrocarbonica]